MSRAFEAAMKRERAVEMGEEPVAEPSKQEIYNPEKSLRRKIMESSLYDWNPTARLLLCELVVMAMKDEDSNYPEDAPASHHADKVGWCWLSQFKLSLRVGCDEGTIGRWIGRFREDGVIDYRDWRDDNMTLHAEYRVRKSVVDAFQRPSQKRETCNRPKRYKSRPKSTQPRTAAGKFANATKRGIMEVEDE